MKRTDIKAVLTMLQIVLWPVCIAIAVNDMAKWWFAVATMLFMLKLYIEGLKPND